MLQFAVRAVLSGIIVALIPALLRHGIGFGVSLAAGCVLTILLYLAVVAIAARFGVTL